MKAFPFSCRIFFAFAALIFAASPAYPGTVIIPGASGGAFNVDVKSIKEAKFNSTIKQQYDFSCGSAALATLLTYHYEKNVGEQEIFNAMFEAGNKDRIRAQGFSLLDMKNYLDTHGYEASGVKASLDNLEKIGVPAIVLVTIHGYKHFVVLKGISKEEVLLGDPATGTRVIPRAEFNSMWNGLLFLIRNNKHVAKHHFNSENEWLTRVKAPLGQALRNGGVTDMTIFLR